MLFSFQSSRCSVPVYMFRCTSPYHIQLYIWFLVLYHIHKLSHQVYWLHMYAVPASQLHLMQTTHCANILSFAEEIPPLIQLLKSLLTPMWTKSIPKACMECTCTAYIVTTLRNQATLQLFLDQAVDAHLHIEDISLQARQSCVQFQHHVTLETQRRSIFVHKIIVARGI